jgi:hypothetical protein
MSEGMDQLGQWLLTATLWRVGTKNLDFCSSTMHLLFRNLQKRSLAHRERGNLQTCYPLCMVHGHLSEIITWQPPSRNIHHENRNIFLIHTSNVESMVLNLLNFYQDQDFHSLQLCSFLWFGVCVVADSYIVGNNCWVSIWLSYIMYNLLVEVHLIPPTNLQADLPKHQNNFYLK